MYRIFISYNSESKPVVAKLAADLGITGHEIWFDHQLTGGQAWWDQILEQIRQCDVFVFALTSAALESYACKLEYTYAHKLGKPVLPVKMDNGVPIHQLPDELQLIQFVDYTTQDTQAAFRLMNALNSAPAAQPLPDPLPEAPPVPLSYVGKLREQIDSPTALSFDAQASLIFKLRERLQEGDSPEDAIELLKRMRRREDLYAKIDREIDSMLGELNPAPVPPPPVQSSPPPPPVQRAPRRETVTDQTPAPQPAQAASGRRLWLPLFIGSAIIGFFGAYLLDEALYNFWRYGELPSVGLLLILGAPPYLLHGYFVARILHTVMPQPRVPMTLGWAIRSALMGGPLNGLILRRVSTSIGWGHVILVAAGWMVAAVVSLIVADAVFFRWSSINSVTWGILTGIIGTLVTYMMYRRVRE